MLELKGVTKNDILKDPEHFVALLREHAAVGFRQIGLERSEFEDVLVSMGFDDSPIAHDVDHATRFEQIEESPNLVSSDLFLTWHVEDFYKEHPPTVLALNMHTFKASWDQGMTGFVDMHHAYLFLPDKWKEGLSDARAIEEQVAYFSDPLNHHPSPIIDTDPLTGETVLRIQGYKNATAPPYRIDLDTCKGLTEGDLLEINEWAQDYMYTYEAQDWWWWGQGDMVLFGGFRLGHAVSYNEFELGDRVFDRGAYHGGHDGAWKVPLMDPRKRDGFYQEGVGDNSVTGRPR